MTFIAIFVHGTQEETFEDLANLGNNISSTKNITLVGRYKPWFRQREFEVRLMKRCLIGTSAGHQGHERPPNTQPTTLACCDVRATPPDPQRQADGCLFGQGPAALGGPCGQPFHAIA